ncbi:TipAS antibiotic-recognition domain-containing protein [Metabacillus sp. RGM 3146]|uniref:TipAS antibiotic-recognition domain-containing protein n=1 Tax=Metabacillus sp. RGM 3146 TaxID=3401092 RepID=UPI003B9C1754
MEKRQINLFPLLEQAAEYFTQEQQEKMFKQIGLEKRKQYVSEWSEITAKIRVEYEKGTSPENLDVTQLAKQWNEFVNKLTFEDPEIAKAAQRYYKENPEIGEKLRIDKQLSEYIKRLLCHTVKFIFILTEKVVSICIATTFSF